MTGLMNGRPGARLFRRLLTEESVKAGAGLEVLRPPLTRRGMPRKEPRTAGRLSKRPGLRPTGLYASCEWRHLFVNLSLTLSSAFLLLKDLQRNRLAGRLTRAPARSNP